MPRVYVGVGSNLEPERHVAAALKAMRARFPGLLTSPVYASAAEGFDGPPFLNLVVAFDTEEAPETVQRALARGWP